jgi:hypothetical protein
MIIYRKKKNAGYNDDAKKAKKSTENVAKLKC